MAKVVGLPKLSPTMEEGTLAAWVKKEGDAIEVDDLLAEVETDKATMEFRSFDRGVLLKILAEEGATLAPDAPVAIIGDAGEDISALLEGISSGAAPAAAKPAKPPQPESPTAPTPSAAASTPGNGRILASPVVRKIARERKIDLSGVAGSGPRGRIIKRDLDGAAARPQATAHAAVAARETTIEPLSQMRKAIARRLTESKQNVPHFYLTIDIDAEPLLEARAAINVELAALPNDTEAKKVSVNDMIIKAVAAALRRYPRANASFREDGIHVHGRVDISVAVAVDDGLITPVIRGADQKGVAQIAAEIRELAGRARKKKLKPEEFSDGTFSISNLGMYGIEEFSAVINPPEGAILAVGTIRNEPVVKDGAVVPGKRMRMTMSCDHRVIDGAIGAEFLRVLTRMLEQPAAMLL